MKTINLRDTIYRLEKFIDVEGPDFPSIPIIYLKASLRTLKDIQNVLIFLDDEDWDQLDLDVEFIL